MGKTKRGENKRVDNLERKLAEMERQVVQAEFDDDNELARKLWSQHAKLERKLQGGVKDGSDSSSDSDY